MIKYYDHRCACGCGGLIELKSYHKYYGIPIYISGHNTLNKKYSEETKKKISESKKGKNRPLFSDEWKENISNSMKGKNKGRKRPDIDGSNHPIHKRDVFGKNNSNWKGGISYEPYCQVWSDKEFKDSIKERDKYRCLNPTCEHKSNRLCIHHIDYNKKNCDPENLLTLCNSCNARANGNRLFWQQLFSSIVNNKDYIVEVL